MKMKYKYIIVSNGNKGRSSTERLLSILPHSGAVILLQTSDVEYYFSNRLKPWVHYVPIAYNAADLIKKILWLQEHDEFAYRIARNAKIFGKSFMRLEDYYCWVAAVLKSLGELFNGTDALIPFDPVRIENIQNLEF